jgi:hypothetical protein
MPDAQSFDYQQQLVKLHQPSIEGMVDDAEA